MVVPFVDTNWLVAAYFLQKDRRQSEIVQRFTSKMDVRWLVSPLAVLEAKNAFGRISGQRNPPEWFALQGDFESKLILAEFDWSTLQRKAEVLFERFSHKAAIGSLDMMLLAHALNCGATHFLSFDSGSNLRALAAAMNLKVFPELSADDKQMLHVLKQGWLQVLNPPPARRGFA